MNDELLKKFDDGIKKESGSREMYKIVFTKLISQFLKLI